MHDTDFDPYLPPRAPVGLLPSKSHDTDAIHGNPWLTVWTRPRSTIRGIVDTDPTRSVMLLAAITGISSTLNNSLRKNPGDVLSLPAILGVALIGGPLFGIIGNRIGGAMVRKAGSWIGGVATAEECRAAIAWASVPQAVNLILILGLIAVFGNDLFRSAGLEDAGASGAVLLLAVALAQVVLGIWSGVLTLKCVGEVHRFSAWKALGTFLLLSLVVIGVILLIVAAVVALVAIMKVQA